MVISKVIFVCNYAADYEGNFIASLKLLSDQLNCDGIKSAFVFPLKAKKKYWAKTLEKTKTVLYSDFSYSKLKYTITEIVEKDCVIHTHFLGARETLAIRKAAKSNKIIHHMHNRYGAKDDLIRKLLKRFIYHNVNFIGISPAVYDDLTRIFDKEKCFYVPNAIYLERLDNTINNFDDDNSKKKIVLIFGTYFKTKGVDIAIRALNMCDKKNNLELHIVAHDVIKTEEIIKKEFSEVPPNVKIILPVTDVQCLYNNAMVFISPSREEGFGYAVVEAAYCKCQVIATNIAGQNVLQDIPYVHWISANSPHELSQEIYKALQKSINNAGILVKEKNEQREYIKQHYSVEAWCTEIVNSYYKICNDNRRV